MRIAFTNWSNRMVGGAEQYLAQMSEHMLTRGHELSLWHQSSEPEDRPVMPVAARIPTWDVSRLGAARAVAGLRRWEPDVIYCQGSVDPETEAETLKIAPSVFFAHNYHGTCISGSKCTSFPVVRPCDRRFGSACLAHYLPRRCGGLSPFTMIRSYLLNRRRLEVLGGYSQVVTHSESLMREYMRHGIDCERLRFFAGPGAERPQGVTEWIPSTSWRLLMIGRMISTKGGELLLDALPRLSMSLNRPICLTLAGDGPSRAEWEKQAARIRMRCPEVEIRFPGWVTGERRERILRESDLLVVPSVWPEPFGIVGIEAGAFSVPAVGFRVGGIPDWLFDGRNGALASGDRLDSPSLADAVRRCLCDEPTYRRLRAGAFDMSRQMTVDLHYEDLMAVFDRLNASPERAVLAGRRMAADQKAAL